MSGGPLAQGRDGGVVVITGTDGAGKSAVAAELMRSFLPKPVLHLHHRPGLLPNRIRHGAPVTQPHRDEPYSIPLSTLKVIYLWADYLVGWMLRVRPHLRRGGWVLLERGWWDLAVDPRRYRLAPLPRLVRFIALLLPRPRVTIILQADPDVVLQRKEELPAAEIARQQAAWAQLPVRRMNAVIIDANQPLSTVVRRVEDAIRCA